MIERYEDFFLGIIMTIISGVLVVVSMGIENRIEMPLTASAYPRFLLTCMGVLSIILLLQSIHKLRKGTELASNGKKKGGKVLLLDALSLLGIIFAVFLFKPLGFVLSMILYLLYSFLLFIPKQERNLKIQIPLAVGYPIVIYLLFVRILNISLPAGILKNIL